MTGADEPAVAQSRAGNAAMTVWVLIVTAAFSVVALVHAPLMDAMVRDVDQLRAGQWWRVASPVLVQSSGWGQLVFNMAGLAVVGAALEQRVSRVTWLTIYLAGGIGSVAVLSVWMPRDGGAGSSDAVAALIGALAVVSLVDISSDRVGLASQMYSVFFVAYLTGLAVGGTLPSIIAGDVAVVLLMIVRRAWSRATLHRACLSLVVVGGAAMTVERQGHGIGIVVGMTIAIVIVVRRRVRRRLDPQGARPRQVFR